MLCRMSADSGEGLKNVLSSVRANMQMEKGGLTTSETFLHVAEMAVSLKYFLVP